MSLQIDTTNGRRDNTHIPLGIFLIAIGLGALWVARDYDTGTFTSMGPGFFPKGISGCMILMGILVVLLRGKDLPEVEEDGQEAPTAVARLRIIGLVTASILVFAATLSPLGLPVATFFMVTIAGFSHRGSQPLTILATAIVLAAFATGLFAWLLGLQIPVLPEALR
ncbi:tripartite tricarboxylate transporter TctB family protein [Rhizobium sp. S163]|jgi:hypothetical protein|uniref:tripartite tricarboxylate transporter TctB family protein n=1 Tax=Rhizobium sp. S163 TaxID=3055039 RepID=UPI000DDF9A16|nr:tripartite tricarboxylate transporter TctB family protein [Rhizobium sp. S163]MDM9645828.1 tripartite tricarboxylate transporter TctB family protein [Rhizobium sp. S163]